MSRARVLGEDPVPGSPSEVDRLAAVLRESVLGLSSSRRVVEHLLSSQAWLRSAVTEAAHEELGRYVLELRRVEDAVVDYAAAVAGWREVLGRHAAHADELAQRAITVAAAPTGPGAGSDAAASAGSGAGDHHALSDDALGDDAGHKYRQREALDREVVTLATAHRRAGAEFERAGDELVGALLPNATAADNDLAAALGRSLQALEAAVREWVRDVRDEMLATDADLHDATALATTVTALLGVDADVPGVGDPRVAALVGGSPAAHRLEALLSAPLADGTRPLLAPAGLAAAASASTLAGRLRRGAATGAGVATGTATAAGAATGLGTESTTGSTTGSTAGSTTGSTAGSTTGSTAESTMGEEPRP